MADKILDYYSMDKEELDYRIYKIKDWMDRNPNDMRWDTAKLAYMCAVSARNLLEEGVDDFTQMCIDCLTK